VEEVHGVLGHAEIVTTQPDPNVNMLRLVPHVVEVPQRPDILVDHRVTVPAGSVRDAVLQVQGAVLGSGLERGGDPAA
jgi:hypothetical protein